MNRRQIDDSSQKEDGTEGTNGISRSCGVGNARTYPEVVGFDTYLTRMGGSNYKATGDS